jgi:signal peptidase complex subunit 2
MMKNTQIFNTEFNFKENHKHTDIKLVLGYGASAFAIFASVYGYLIPFPTCKPVLLVCVLGYSPFSPYIPSHIYIFHILTCTVPFPLTAISS